MKELRPGSIGSSEVRILFVFDAFRRLPLPGRQPAEQDNPDQPFGVTSGTS